MLETPEEIARLQLLLDRSAAGAGPHLRGIITDERRLSAEQVCQALPGMRLPLQGREFETWLDGLDAIGARIAAEKMFTFHATG